LKKTNFPAINKIFPEKYMKRILLPLMLAAVLLITATETRANVYASGIRISDATVTDYNLAGSSWDMNFSDSTGLKIWFIINESGVGTLSATVKIYSGATLIRSLNPTSPAKGINSVIWDGFKDNNQPAPAGNYSFEVVVADPVGHTTFDSVWVASAYYQGPDPDGGTAYAYRGNASVMDQSNAAFGTLFVSRGTTSANGFYRYQADGTFLNKVATTPTWPASTPNEVTVINSKVYGLAGYGFTGGGNARGFNLQDFTFADSLPYSNVNLRGLTSKKIGSVSYVYSTVSAAGVPCVVRFVQGSSAVDTLFTLSPYISTTSGYGKAVAVDDDGYIYVAFGNASASRKKIGKFSQLGQMIWVDSLDAHGLASTAIFQAIAIANGQNALSASDDILYALVNSGTASQWGIYKISLDGTTYTQLVSPAGGSGAATSQIINVDAAGNVVWSNGSAQERIVMFSPAAGPNSYTTSSHTGIVVTIPVPVELTSFTASISGKNVVLNWSTASETNNRGFEVERNSGQGWQGIGFVNGMGTTVQTVNYEFIDRNISGNLVYRLKQIDYDGSFEYSDEITAELNIPDGFELSQNYPNPFNPVTTIQFKLPVDSKVTLEVYSISGELVSVLADEFRTAGQHNVNFDASALSSGTYIYRLTAGQMTITRKMVLMK
jgi:flagellar hook assembly protein FlgD